MDEQRQWHRLFGMSLCDLFAGLPVLVEMEKDLSLKQQLLDVVVVTKGPEPLNCTLPDGFEDLAAHNLISFKSHQETLDAWALQELVGHYVNYRKQASPSMNDLLPEADFKLFAVSVRFPQGLSRQWPLEPLREGVYRLPFFGGQVRLVVVHQLPEESRNAVLHLFSALNQQRLFGARTYRPRSKETSKFLYQLYDQCREEGMPMPFTKEEFIRDVTEKMLKDPVVLKLLKEQMPPEDLLEMLKEQIPVEALLESVPIEKRLESVPIEKRLESVPIEKRLEGISEEDLRAALERRRQDPPIK